jgi:hypothetical protein
MIRDYLYREPWWRRWLNRLLRRRKTWSPFDDSGHLRDDLMAVKKVDGKWVANERPNDGFWPINPMRED